MKSIQLVPVLLFICVYSLEQKPKDKAKDKRKNENEIPKKKIGTMEISEEEIKDFCNRHFDCHVIERCEGVTVSDDGEYGSCAELLCAGMNNSNVYEINAKTSSRVKKINVTCDMETDGGGWMVIQRRGEYSHCHVNFTQDWDTYTKGFGNIEEEFWLGNENIHMLTSSENMVLRIDMGDFEGVTKYAIYDKFKVGTATENYKLTLGTYSGNAGDSFGYANGMPFTTYDRDDKKHCSRKYKCGWWFRFCHRSYLNGIYLGGKNKNFAKGIVWQSFRGDFYSLKWSEMKIRPKSFNDG